MQIHGRAKLGPAGRLGLCEAIEDGMTFRQAAELLHVSPATAHRWWHRYRDASAQERHSLAWAADRSSRPHRSPRLLDVILQERICEARLRTGWGPRLIAGETGFAHSTIWKVLRRHGLSQRPRQPRDTARRYEWPCPDDLLHMDTAATRGLSDPGTESPETAHNAPATGWSPARGWATTLLMRSLMTTQDWPTSSCTAMSAPRPSLQSRM